MIGSYLSFNDRMNILMLIYSKTINFSLKLVKIWMPEPWSYAHIHHPWILLNLIRDYLQKIIDKNLFSMYRIVYRMYSNVPSVY